MMKWIKNITALLLLMSLSIEPCICASETPEQQVAKMSEAEMRSELPKMKQRVAILERAMKSGNYSIAYQNDVKWTEIKSDANDGSMGAIAAPAEYEQLMKYINAIEKRLKVIDDKREQERKRKEEEERQKQEQKKKALEEQAALDAQRDAEREAFIENSRNAHMRASDSQYSALHDAVEAKKDAITYGDEALKMTGPDEKEGFSAVTYDMRNKTSQRPLPTNRDLTGKFPPKAPKEEQKPKEEPDPDLEKLKRLNREADDIFSYLNDFD